MHVLYLHQYFVPPDGSGGTRSFEMARRLVKEGHKVTLITSSAFFPAKYQFKEQVSELEIEGICLRVIHVPYSNKLGNLQRIKAFCAFAVKASVEAAKVSDVDVVFATSTPLTIALPGVFSKLWHRSPMVFEVRDLWPEIPIAVGALKNPVVKAVAGWLEKAAYRSSAHVVALSPGMKDGVVRAGYPEQQVSVVPNSCDIELFSPRTDKDYFQSIKGSSEEPVILYAGTFGLINGVDYLVHLAEAMLDLDPRVRFAIVGDGKQRPEVLQLAREKKVLEKNFWILPPVAKSKMPEVLSSCTVACSVVIDLPPLWHNSANKFFDAFAAGKPMLINHYGWQADVIEDNGAGLVVPPNDPASAAKMLHAFLNEPKRVENAGKAAAQLAATVFSRDQLFEKLLICLQSATKPSHSVRTGFAEA